MPHSPEPARLATLAGTQSLERGLSLIEHAVADAPTIDELARTAGLNMSVTRRLVAGLINQGFLTLGPGRRLHGGPKLIRLGIQAQGRLDVVAVARPFLEALSDATGIPSFLGERVGDFSVHLYRQPGRQRVVVNTPVGTRRPLAETSLGKALLLDDVDEWERIFAAADPAFVTANWRENMTAARAAGAVTHVSPPPDRVHAIAAPVRDAAGRIVAAISVVSLPQYVDDAMMAATRDAVLTTAAGISGTLGHGA